SSVADLEGTSVSKKLFNQKLQEEKHQTDRRITQAVREKNTELKDLQKRIDNTTKKLNKTESELSQKSTYLIGVEEQLKNCRKQLEEKENEAGFESLDADLSVLSLYEWI